MCLEIGCLVCHPRIACGVRLVESVRSKLLPVGPYLLKYFRVVSVLLSPLNEFWLHCINNGLLLLTHSLTQSIRFASGEVGKLSRQKHHLLLVHSNAIGVLEVFLHARDVVLNLFLAILTGNERGDVIHRSRTIKGVHGYKVLEDSRP